jgi:spore maturation protein CgeB
MKGKLKFSFFAHSWISDWNHGNAHFLRGLVRELMRAGHQVRCYEELGAWSLTNLVRNEGELASQALNKFRETYPELDVRFYSRTQNFSEFLDDELSDTDLVVVHEWNDPVVVNEIVSRKQQFGFKALFHDTHHRAYTRAGEILRFHLHLFDGVLAFGEAIRSIYHDGFGLSNVWTFHEAADPTVFHPVSAPKMCDVVWIGNWGDEERTRELLEFLVEPASEMKEKEFVVYGVRYPDQALRILEEAGIEYRGYLPNLMSPAVYAGSLLSLHVPRRQYANGLSGIPTIRVFEALACGVPLVCAPWSDAEHLFRPGEDYVCVPDGDAMRTELAHLLRDEDARRQIGLNGLETIRNKHTCAHRAAQLLDICSELAQ